jgi:hypothetical protein
VQFTDGARSVLSEILTVQVDLEFYSNGGIYIGEGDGVIFQRNVDVHIEIPVTAVGMRVHHNKETLLRMPYGQLADTIEYIFPVPNHDEPAPIVEIFVQFTDGETESEIYGAAAQLDVFPIQHIPFEIEGGASEVNYRLVQIDIDVPVNAFQMRIFEDLKSKDHPLWIPASSAESYLFEKAGLKKLYLQFRDQDGIESAAFMREIFVLPFVVEDDVFLINGGDAFTNDRDVLISLDPPSGAIAFRFAEGEAPSSHAGWSNLVPNFIYRLTGYGQRNIYLQYKDVSGDVSTNAIQSIFYDPFFGDQGDFEINGGTLATDHPLLGLAIDLPAAAFEMRVFDTAYPNYDWMTISTSATTLLSTPGFYEIGLQFRTISGDLSPVIKRTIYYDPFPISSLTAKINGGAASTNDPNVTIDLDFPPMATGVRMSESLSSLASEPVQSVSASMSFTLSPTLGVKKVYLQYVSDDDRTSEVFFDTIELQ